MLFGPVHDAVVDEALPVEEVLEQPPHPVVVGLLLVLQRAHVVEVTPELFWVRERYLAGWQ